MNNQLNTKLDQIRRHLNAWHAFNCKDADEGCDQNWAIEQGYAEADQAMMLMEDVVDILNADINKYN